ncbi:thioredoxin-like protein [Lipomyces oligophaga]|uniref:thioredoxin-like protein n=1 Tax=Lipomyces oligophaga TaxID=45792 RepID=UPI0034CDFB8E
MPPRKEKAPIDQSTLRRSSRVLGPPSTKGLDLPVKRAKLDKTVKESKTDTEFDEKVKDEKKDKDKDEPDEKDGSKTKIAEESPSTELQIGDSLPDISIPDDQGTETNLSTLTGSIVIFAYPKASTPGCTRQACGFRDDYPRFEKAGVRVFGLSADSISAQEKFKLKQSLPYPLLADTQYKLIGPLGAKKTAKGGITRSYWIVKDGKIVTKVIGVKPEVSVEKSLAALV